LGTPAIEAFGVLENRLVAPLTDRVEDRAYVGLDAGEIFVAAPAQRR
jgi:hypothetical protein